MGNTAIKHKEHKAVLNNTPWEILIHAGIEKLLESKDIAAVISKEHTKETPLRFVNALREYFAGVYKDPREVLTTEFAEKYDEMVIVKDISFVSFCAHHLAPFSGKVHFGYIPNKKIVGLSKIPRLIEVLSKRPQVQEKLTVEIADIFMEVVKPKGCAVSIEATHLCMAHRGVKKEGATTKTCAVRGVFKGKSTKQEFMSQIGGK